MTDLKNTAGPVFENLGLSNTQAITLFYKQVEVQNGLSFRVQIPTRDTISALEDAKNRRGLKSFIGMTELLGELKVKI